MFNANRPARSDLPTTQQLLKSTGLAAVIAGGLLVAVVLPAEYGIDPTRLGSVFGLTEMGRIKRQLAAEEAAEASSAPAVAADAPAAAPPAQPAPASATAARSDETTITLAPDEAAEIKLTMSAGATARYAWSSSGGKINFDMHADRPGVKYHAYGKGSAKDAQGELKAAFDGAHGWFWRNRTGGPVTIVLKTNGAYSQIKRMV
ncbi:transmembrane anchor protein [Caulobacter flavus]|uniref:Transmembrane anchor protein n=1 Tax=Caulobacter flavus TaxID=1679497 RepID=A0A2N5CPZ1_9CAUL|nr:MULTISPECIES: hypothetical protein [Caulobacter]PLR09223.1 transmembrane anchor protein [Caulobacter flavus]